MFNITYLNVVNFPSNELHPMKSGHNKKTKGDSKSLILCKLSTTHGEIRFASLSHRGNSKFPPRDLVRQKQVSHNWQFNHKSSQKNSVFSTWNRKTSNYEFLGVVYIYKVLSILFNFLYIDLTHKIYILSSPPWILWLEGNSFLWTPNEFYPYHF